MRKGLLIKSSGSVPGFFRNNELVHGIYLILFGFEECYPLFLNGFQIKISLGNKVNAASSAINMASAVNRPK